MQNLFLLVTVVVVVLFGFVTGNPTGVTHGRARTEAEIATILAEKETAEANKAIVRKVIDGFNERDVSVVDKYYSATGFVQHDPNIADGTAGLKDHLQAAFAKHPIAAESKMEILRMAADGDLVFVHLQKRSPDTGNPVSIIHVYRLSNPAGQLKKIVEHWALFAELTPEIVASSKNLHPLF